MQRRAIAALGDRHQARAHAVGDLARAVGAAIVGDQHLAGDARAGQETLRLEDAGRQRLGLVEARHQDGELDRVGRRLLAGVQALRHLLASGLAALQGVSEGCERPDLRAEKP